MARVNCRAFAVTGAGLLVIAAAGCSSDDEPNVAASSPRAAAPKDLATAEMKLADGTSIGTVRFADEGTDQTRVSATLNVPAGRTPFRAFHGFHIHANSDPANGEGCLADAAAAPSTWFVAVDGHWKADGQDHGSHRGDLPSLQLDARGRASTSFVTERLTAADIRSKAVILHAGPDNFGNIAVGSAPDQYSANSDAAKTKTAGTGNAGDRVACGIITPA